MIKTVIDAIADQSELFMRLLLACLCGAVIGFERSIRRKDAGIKTHVILALGAALTMIISQYGFADLNLTPEMKADVSRIASNILTSVSFLCAGVIFVRGASVKGLTTATGIWATASIGMAAGAGMYVLTIFATCLIIVIHLLLVKISAKIETHYYLDVELKIPDSVTVESVVGSISSEINASPSSIKLTKADGEHIYKINFNVEHTINEAEIIQKISENEYVSHVSWTAL